MKYSAERELRVLQIVKELKLASKLDVEERYRELFKEDLEELGLILRRWVARGALTTLGKKYKIAGVYVTEGKVVRGGSVRAYRKAQVVHESAVISLKRFKEDAREVSAGYECGVQVDGFNDFQTGDILEFFHKEMAS